MRRDPKYSEQLKIRDRAWAKLRRDQAKNAADDSRRSESAPSPRPLQAVEAGTVVDASGVRLVLLLPSRLSFQRS